MMTVADRPRRIALLNFGGIGDEILFTPVLREIRAFYPEAHLALILEDRSRAIADLLPGVDEVIPLNVQQPGRLALFGKLVALLRRGNYDAVVSSGSSPFIPVMLAATGIRVRVGYQTGPTSKLLLSAEAPPGRPAWCWRSTRPTFPGALRRARARCRSSRAARAR